MAVSFNEGLSLFDCIRNLFWRRIDFFLKPFIIELFVKILISFNQFDSPFRKFVYPSRIYIHENSFFSINMRSRGYHNRTIYIVHNCWTDVNVAKVKNWSRASLTHDGNTCNSKRRFKNLWDTKVNTIGKLQGQILILTNFWKNSFFSQLYQCWRRNG